MTARGLAPATDRRPDSRNPRSASELQIVHHRQPTFRVVKAERVMAKFSKRHRQGHVLFAHNDEMALGAIRALEAADLKPGKDIQIISIDATRAAFEAMIAGKLNATVECNPLMGPQLMTSVTEVVSGRSIARRAVVDEAVFTQDNARQVIQTRKY